MNYKVSISIGFLAFLVLAACDRRPREPVEPLQPAVPAQTRTVLTDEGSFRVTYKPSPDPIPLNEHFSLGVGVTPYAESDSLPEGLTIEAEAIMPEHAHGMTVQPEVGDRGHGSFEVEGMLFHMPGKWEIYIDVMHNGVTETAVFPVEMEI
jgi:hypothetical protein